MQGRKALYETVGRWLLGVDAEGGAVVYREGIGSGRRGGIAARKPAEQVAKPLKGRLLREIPSQIRKNTHSNPD